MTPKEELVDELAGDAAELRAIRADIRRKLAHLPAADVRELARVVDHLVHAFQTERIYVFGSQARGVPTANSDFDLLVVVTTSDQLPHHRAQAAYRAVGAHHIPLDILVMTQEEFNARLPAVASLPATVAREGLTLYAVAA
jgi:hypothetical protein